MCGKTNGKTDGKTEAIQKFVDAHARFVAAVPKSKDAIIAVFDLSDALAEYEGSDVTMAKSLAYAAEHGMTSETFRAYMDERLAELQAAAQ